MFNVLFGVASPWFTPLVWMDYRLAAVFTVLLPLILLIWAFVQKAEAMQRLLTIYGRVASLFLITVYLMIAALPIGFVSLSMAQVLIPLSLWFWVDLNEEIADQPKSPLKFAFTSWRWAITAYSSLTALASVPFLKCAFLKTKQELLEEPFCRVWLDPPWMYKEMFHSDWGPRFLGFIGLLALVIYVAYLSYFVLIKLGKQGRSATGQ